MTSVLALGWEADRASHPLPFSGKRRVKGRRTEDQKAEGLTY
ncbi:hypothetical protein HMPREF0620_0549 [Parascardovia denticolens DSM 10105 = JCM 12538]|uniref:Uncharacterized protein n=1 Tax=Parascardovia denticolens DSM 10105 = JCM 12538 TaxID=864564 RepID=E6K163_PARDN|nr:hypothetical protein HMPREF0620_0549 [Parascardovia denticolens DSM 10105 = JCM 12538]